MTSLSISRALALTAVAVLLSACGGKDDHSDATFATTIGTATPTAASISNGKLLYNQYCVSCHGSNMPAAKDSHNLLNAINSNRGGMGSLSGAIKASQADDIAGYLAFGL
jgi:mono/diheme cytochrome c family protein